ncbi:MAG: type II toxin-antitoxin system VapC family toxin [Pirellulaceae bacterium]
MKILLDSNILLRLSEPGHPHHVLASEAIQSLADQQHLMCVVPQNLYEYWVVATRPPADNGLGFTVEQAEQELAQICSLFSLHRDERTVLEHWRRLVVDHAVRGRKSHDARLVAAMQRHGMSHILTFNTSDFAAYPTIVVIEPQPAL